LDPLNGSLVPGGIAAETGRALANLRSVLQAAGCDLEDIVKTTVYLADMADFNIMNTVYTGFFPHDPPARTTIQAAALPKGARVEIDAVATL
jgi:2-iminobutanoate/2-iminopropanoate deaminase